MPRRVPLPFELRSRPFTVAEAARLGLGAGRLRSGDLSTPFRGIRMVGGPPNTHDRRVAALAHAMPEHQFFSHVTAALVIGLPLPPQLAATSELHVSTCAPHRAPRMRGVVGHLVAGDRVALRNWNGIRVTDPVTTWQQLASVLGRNDLVAVGDYLVAEPTPLATTDELRAAAAVPHQLGAQTLREAVGLVRSGSESRLETWTRLVLVDAGLPEPSLNGNAFTARGRFLGRLDLSYPEFRVAIEYEGEQHRLDSAQFTHDIDRLDQLVEHGWRVVRVRSTHVFTKPAEVVRRVTVALRERGWRG